VCETVNVADADRQANRVTCSTWESFERYDCSNVGGYQIIKEEILHVPFLLCTFLCNQYLTHSVVNYLL
jgi:hypothetical protein